MKPIYVIAALMMLGQCEALSNFADPVALISDTNDFRDTLVSSEQIAIFEGLPHQTFERDIFTKERNRKDITEFLGYWFYTPAHVPKDNKSIKSIFGKSNILVRYGGPKFCGAFHPDYSVFWKAGGKSYIVIVCFGCQEIVYSEGNRRFIYDIAPESFDLMKQELSPYGTKRPKNEN